MEGFFDKIASALFGAFFYALGFALVGGIIGLGHWLPQIAFLGAVLGIMKVLIADEF